MPTPADHRPMPLEKRLAEPKSSGCFGRCGLSRHLREELQLSRLDSCGPSRSVRAMRSRNFFAIQITPSPSNWPGAQCTVGVVLAAAALNRDLEFDFVKHSLRYSNPALPRTRCVGHADQSVRLQ